ncbi:hypothetical protein SAMN02745216_05224 [Desulfatibacillum alkenivorans DSM 16219]|jgi:hypothetical protein|uniref:Uncharacterized protein n=1 Tax=Desulfatibacillum alkenivorans DSM 16219 TaxID=1121393 RepID=A0A1M7AT86_9BACT|nr:hypothetical protein [Desulfatibacillum alkenivorans]SHL45933.1 hypothetical protein SAMN02745216_05224 [Desulfatibacillum alkenivorans DSM 16219]
MEENGQEKNMTDEEWENRRLCVDGGCIGVIGEDGRCKECGKPYDENLDEASYEAVEREDSLEQDQSDAADGYEDAPDSDDDADDDADDASDDGWDDRKLCSDGNCIGVIGPDGNCKECGKPYDPDAE